MKTNFKRIIFTGFFLFVLIISGRVGSGEERGYLTVTGPCRLEFPRDHGEHPEYRTEWWYYTGNLKTKTGEPYGFQLTFFRHGISPPGAEKKWPSMASAWRTRQVYIAHAAISDISEKRHMQAEEITRGALGMAGVRSENDGTIIFLKNWSASINEAGHILKVHSNLFSFLLNLRSKKQLVLHGRAGYSLKGSRPDRASCYYSFTNLIADGRLEIQGKTIDVAGSGWMDHEFSTALLEPGIVGWDWFSLQLSDQTEIMIFLLRNKNGGVHPASSGTFVDSAGQPHHLQKQDLDVEAIDFWQSGKSGARYPSRWQMRVKPLEIELLIRSNLSDQEMHTRKTSGVIYWEGSVSAEGMTKKKPLSGQGYVELTGYGDAFEAPL